MVEVKYICSDMELSPKMQKVKIEFRRVPTQEQLEKWQAQHKERPNHAGPSIKQTPFGMIAVMQMMGEEDSEIHLNFNTVVMVLTLQEMREYKVEIGMLVKLNMPEVAKDIIKVEE